jgi:amino acid adenylation domain-containing protein
VVEAVRPERVLNRSPLFQVMFALQNTARPELRLPDVAATPVDLDTGSAQFDLTLHIWERDDGLHAVLEYCTALFDAASIERMLEHFHLLLRAAVRHPDEPTAALSFLSDAERGHLLASINDTRAEYPSGVCVHELVEAQAQLTPEAVAVMCGPEVVTYRELDRRANQIAHFLRSLGVGPESFVAILLERSPAMLVGLLGILKSGGAYLPLDPALPAERIVDMLMDSDAPVLLTERSLADRASSYSGIVACVDAERAAIAAQPTTSPPAVASPNGLAYVIYTSGSTGRPKGVQITHRNLVNLLIDMRGRVEMTSADVLVAVTTLSFDIAGLELWLPLIAGARVAIASRTYPTDAVRLGHELQRVRATVMQATPVTWQMLLESGWRGSDRLTAICGGEAMSCELANRLLPKVRRLWNVYGPTETTIWSTAFLVTSANDDHDSGIVPIGLPIANTSVYILDARRQLVPLGTPGELYIGGAGVGRGYLNRPELTAERFIANPFGAGSEERLYQTGDRVRLRAREGAVEFLGRLDDQVKLRGFRIELGEIEAAIAGHPAVQEAAAAIHEVGRGDRRLIAYVVPRPTAEMPAPDSLRTMLGKRLPAYMLPSAVVELEALPRTANGKVDRRRLPMPTVVPVCGECGGIAEMPRNDVERTLQAIWEKVLDVSPIGIGDNFFDLGGHSLLAVRIFSEIRARLGRSLPLVTLFRAPTIERLAEAIARSEPPLPWSPLVPIGQSTGAGEPPLFIIHGLTGEIMNLHALALRLAANRPVYAVRARGLDGGPSPLDRIEDMADYYLDHLRRVQPHGPYQLLGFCFGGLVAFEMARRLSAAGETVAFLGLLDSAFHQRLLAPPGRLRFELAKQRIHIETLRRLPRGERLAYLRSRLVARVSPAALFGNSAVEIPYLAYLPNAADVPAELRDVTIAAARAFCHYEPGLYSGSLTYIRPKIRDFRNILNFAPEWQRKATGGVETIFVPGDHMTMLHPSCVDVLAERLHTLLQTAGAGPS